MIRVDDLVADIECHVSPEFARKGVGWLATCRESRHCSQIGPQEATETADKSRGSDEFRLLFSQPDSALQYCPNCGRARVIHGMGHGHGHAAIESGAQCLSPPRLMAIYQSSREPAPAPGTLVVALERLVAVGDVEPPGRRTARSATASGTGSCPPCRCRVVVRVLPVKKNAIGMPFERSCSDRSAVEAVRIGRIVELVVEIEPATSRSCRPPGCAGRC